MNEAVGEELKFLIETARGEAPGPIDDLTSAIANCGGDDEQRERLRLAVRACLPMALIDGFDRAMQSNSGAN